MSVSAKVQVASGDDGFPRGFGNYVLLTNFAKGGMGEVYLAKTGGIEGVDRLCVLKKLRPDVGHEDEYVRRFIDEARIVVQLSHANICHVFDAGQVGAETYLAMEYIPGATLRDIFFRVKKQKLDVDPAVFVWIMCDILDALDYAHQLKHPMTGKLLNVVHRDISPQNVMVSFDGAVKLIDFGLAASDLKEEQTESQVVMGKVAYMSPEQARGEDVTAACDQFAAAICLYELLVGERYYGEFSNYQIWQVVGRGGFVPSKFTSLDQDVTRILGRALSPKAELRFKTCGDFKEQLELYVNKHMPGSTRRKVRDLMATLYAQDQQQERNFLAQFAEVSAASLRAPGGPAAKSFVTPEPSASVSVAQAPADEGPAEGTAVTPPGALTEDQSRKVEVGQTRAPPPDRFTMSDDDDGPAVTEAVPRGDNTAAVMREAFERDRQRKRLAVAGVLVLLLLLIAGYLVRNQPDSGAVVAAAAPAEAAPPEAAPAEAAPAEAAPAEAAPPEAAPPEAAPPEAAPADDKGPAKKAAPVKKRRTDRTPQDKTAPGDVTDDERPAPDADDAAPDDGTTRPGVRITQKPTLPKFKLSANATWGSVLPYLEACPNKCTDHIHQGFERSGLSRSSLIDRKLLFVVGDCINRKCGM